MPIDKYPFSERYGWIQDKYGLTWQLISTNPAGDPRPTTMPSMLDYAIHVIRRASEQCGWLKNKFGVSWQISPEIMNEMMAEGSKEQVNRLTQAFLKMNKMDIAKLKEAYQD